jgi:DNA polymerase-4
MSQAVRACPGLLVIPPHFRDYREYSRRVMAHLHALTPLVEQLSIDEAFLDVSARTEPAALLARGLQATIRDELGLPASLGVASNKLVAKIANNVGKAAARGDGPPSAIQVVPPGQEAAFLAPLPCDALWGVGAKTAARLQAMGVHTIGDIARRSPEELEALFGKHGREMAAHAQGLDERPVEPVREAKSVSQETTFARDIADGDKLRETLHGLAEGVARDLRRKRVTGTTVKLKLRWADFTTLTRQVTLDQPTDDAARIYSAALQLFERLWEPGRPVRLLGVGVSGLGVQARQMGLWDPPNEKDEKLMAAVQMLRARFGEHALLRASDLEDAAHSSEVVKHEL